MVTYAASQDIYLTGCEVLEKPASLDVSFRVVSPLSDQIQKITSLSDRNGYVAEVVTTLGLLANEKLPIGREYDDLYNLRLGFHFVTADGRPFSADSTVRLSFKY